MAMWPTIAAAALALAAGQDRQERPRIRSGVELVAVDVQVVTRDGHPVTDLGRQDFQVSIAGSRRRVASAEVVRHAAALPAATPRAGRDPLVTPGGSSRRMFVIAVDEHSLKAGHAMAAMEATRRFIDRLDPDDLVALYAYPTGTAQTPLTSDHALVRRSLDRIVGLQDQLVSRFRLTPSEIIDIASLDGEVLARVAARECRGDRLCPKEVQTDALMQAIALEMRVTQSLAGLRALIDGLAQVPSRKTLVLVSGGLPVSDRAGGRVSFSLDLSWVGRAAAASNTNVYALHFDSAFLDSYSVRGTASASSLRDASLFAAGLERIAAAAGGEMFRIETGFGDSAFARVLRETSAHYLLGVEVAESDRDGQAKSIRVRVNRRGVTVRSRTMVVVPRRDQVR